MSTDYDFAIIGAGVVGLAIAAELAPRGTVLVLEKEWKFGQSTSSHNSEVVHGGLYYTPGSLKARLCVEGNRLIRALAKAHGIGYKQIGKYIVAVTDEERAYLEWLKSNAEANGVTDLRWISPEELREHEPDVRAVACLFSPSTGIVDSHALMAHFKTQPELAGADFVFNSEVVSIRRIPGVIVHRSSFIVQVKDSDGSEAEISAQYVINAAGLHSDEIAAMAGMDVKALDLEMHWTRGFYYAPENNLGLRVSHLVYPVPDKSLKSLGVHATIDLQGGLRFGPTAEYMDSRAEDYSFNGLDDLNEVRASIARYLPAVENATLNPIMAGIRPKLTAPGAPARDFYIHEERDHGLPGFVNLIGIESPGLTAAPAIAKYVSRLLNL
jgi:L-2-hydroxyglutarate oxidase LhgO